MKTIILAGGYGTRLGNITEAIPKPMVNKSGDVKHSLAGIEKAKRILGFELECGFEEGLKKIVKSLL